MSIPLTTQHRQEAEAWPADSPGSSALLATPADFLQGAIQNQWLSFLIVLAVTLLAKGGALLPGYAIDDYGPAADGLDIGLLGDVLSKGRVGHWLFLKVAMALQVEPNTARIFFVSLSIIAYAVFGLAVVRFWGIRGNGWLPLAAASIIANHPYTCEIFTFRVGLPPAAFVMALLGALLFLACRPRLRLVLGSLGFALALSFYPIALHFGFMIVLMGVAIGLGRSLESRSAPNADSQPGFDRRRLFEHRNTHLFLYILCGMLLYTLAGALFGRLIGVNAQYFAALPFSAISERMLVAGKLVARTFVGHNVLVPRPVQATFILIVFCLVIGLLRIAFRRPLRRSSFPISIGVLLLLGCAWLWSVGVVLLRQEYWPVPRTMAHVGIFWAGCLVLAALAMPLSWVARGLSLAAVLILVSFVGVNQHILEEQLRLNMRDRHKANRIIVRLEALPGFEAVRRVAVVGIPAWYPTGLQRTQWGDMNISAFGASWSQVSLLREVSGYDLRWATDPQEKAAARAYCSNTDPWPAPGSVAIRGQVGIVCFTRNPQP